MANHPSVIVFASQKGGSGKTTLSGHVAVEAERAGHGPVALIDTDPQGSLAKWWNARAASTPAFAQVPIRDLGEGIEHLKRNGFKTIVIDTPPAVTESIANVVAHADLVVVPTRPSPHDLRAVGPTVDIVESYRKALVFVVNSATARARITGETAVALSQHGVVAPVTIHHRVDFAASMIDGRTVGEVREDSKSAVEVALLWAYLHDRVKRLVGDVEDVDLDRRAEFSAAALTPASATTADVESDGDDEDDDEEIFASAAPAPPPTVKPVVKPEPALVGFGRNEITGEWDGLERRTEDRGPPTGASDRRKVICFGRRRAG